VCESGCGSRHRQLSKHLTAKEDGPGCRIDVVANLQDEGFRTLLGEQVLREQNALGQVVALEHACFRSGQDGVRQQLQALRRGGPGRSCDNKATWRETHTVRVALPCLKREERREKREERREKREVKREKIMREHERA
jgi:hypothetical protein